MRIKQLQKGEPAMSYCNNYENSGLLVPGEREKKVFQALASAELKAHGISAEAYIRGLKTELAAVKKHSSATLLRRKLAATPAR